MNSSKYVAFFPRMVWAVTMKITTANTCKALILCKALLWHLIHAHWLHPNRIPSIRFHYCLHFSQGVIETQRGDRPSGGKEEGRAQPWQQAGPTVCAHDQLPLRVASPEKYTETEEASSSDANQCFHSACFLPAFFPCVFIWCTPICSLIFFLPWTSYDEHFSCH